MKDGTALNASKHIITPSTACIVARYISQKKRAWKMRKKSGFAEIIVIDG